VAYRRQVTDSGYSEIFTFEGDWEKDLKDKSSMRPNLETSHAPLATVRLFSLLTYQCVRVGPRWDQMADFRGLKTL
jgi:hypothetical protein